MSFHASKIAFGQIYYAFAEKPERFFRAGLKEKTSAIWENDWNSWRDEILFGQRPRTSIVSKSRTLKFFEEMDPLFVE